jgi:ATP-dependent Clp endopeptidase proteolytic subunit ClpP
MPIIAINDVIDDYTVFEVDTILQNADLDKDFDIMISSPGGSITAGLQIVAKLDTIKGNKTVYIQGLAASMATVIASAGDKVVMSENGFYMIHNPWTILAGDADQMRTEADLMDKMKDQLIDIYSRKTNLSKDELSGLMDAETWLTPQEAIEAGFVDEIKAEQMAIAASMVRDPSKLQGFKNLPEELKQKLKGVSAMADFEEVEELEVDELETSEEVEYEVEELEEDLELEEEDEISEDEAVTFFARILNAVKGKPESKPEVDYKAKYSALLDENDQLAELANGQQNVIDELEGRIEDISRDVEEKYNECDMVIDAIIDSKITAHQLKQFKAGELSDEDLATAIKHNDLGIKPQAKKEDTLKPVGNFSATVLPNRKLSNEECNEWLNSIENKAERSKAFAKYRKQFK